MPSDMVRRNVFVQYDESYNRIPTNLPKRLPRVYHCNT